MDNPDPNSAPPTSPSPSSSSSDWQARAADTVEATVAAVHDRVVRPLIIVARAIVFGIVVASMALVLCVLLSVALVRLLDVYAFGGRAWASEALVGTVLAAVGVAAWSLRRARHAAEEK
ncbi:MAG: hypothetical protein ABSB99_03500 [Acidimicrobiales bacterium]